MPATQKVTSTNIFTQYIWANKKENNKKFSISLLDTIVQIQLFDADKDGKISNKPSVSTYFSQLTHNMLPLLQLCEWAMHRLDRIAKGEMLESENGGYTIFHSKSGIKDAKYKMSVDVYTKKSAKDDTSYTVCSITLAARNSTDGEWTSKDVLYISGSGTANVYCKPMSHKLTDAYQFFLSLYHILYGIIQRTSPKWDAHWKAYFEAQPKGNSNSGDKKVSSENKANSSPLDDEDIW